MPVDPGKVEKDLSSLAQIVGSTYLDLPFNSDATDISAFETFHGL